MTAQNPRIAVIGYGAMTRSLIASLSRDAAIGITGIFLPPEIGASMPQDLKRFSRIEDLIEARPPLVIECASHDAVRTAVPGLLRAGIDVVVVSIGALADPATWAALEDAASSGGSRMTVATGAIGGLDVLRAAKLAGLDEVTYVGRKPPEAWKNTPAEDLLDLDGLTEAAVFFEGTAAQAASRYPKNANVCAAVALAGVGFEKTRVKLVADPASSGNVHHLEANGAFGRFAIEIANRPLPDNPKTSWLAALSVEQTVRRHFQSVEC